MNLEPKRCCTPARETTAAAGRESGPAPARTVDTSQRPGPALVQIPATRFAMGNDAADGFIEDGEGPSRMVSLSAFAIAPTTVTNREFADFVRATRHVTDAERLGSSFVFYLQVDAAVRREIRTLPPGLPWWIDLANACWQRPEGPGSHVRDRPEHPVVHVSWHDCAAYCAWSGTRLPTEAEWECAARGGLAGRRYPWGDELEQDGAARCNIWRGGFPNEPAVGWLPGTVPAASFEPNGFGLYGTAGNVWEWCADWFMPAYHRETVAQDPHGTVNTGRRSMRGGSFLCHDSYCNRYRVAARGSNSPSSSASNIGFRVAAQP